MKRSVNRLQQRIENGKRTYTEPSRRLRRKHRIDEQRVNAHTVWTMAPKRDAGRNHIIYLHGGAYVNSFASQHWSFMSKLVAALNCTVVAPDYPHAPEHYVHDTIGLVLQVYKNTTTLAGSANNVTLMGDSSGGGISLALAQRLREERLDQPGNIVLLSPWLDATMSNAEIPAIDKIDPFLGVEGLKWGGRVYARDVEPTNPLVSPVYGSLHALAPISVFIGTRDVFLPDCRKLRDKAESEGITVGYYEYEGMVHNWMLGPMPEAKRVIKQIVDKLRA